MTAQEKKKALTGEDDWGLSCVKLDPTDWFFIKNKVSAAQPGLLGALPGPGQATLVLLGTNTGECIAHSLKDFVEKGYKCLVITDLLGDYHHSGSDAGWHEESLRHAMKLWIPDKADRIRYPKAAAFLNNPDMAGIEMPQEGKEKPGLPSRQPRSSSILRRPDA